MQNTDSIMKKNFTNLHPLHISFEKTNAYPYLFNGINDKNTVRPYLTIIRNLFKNQGFLFINKSFIYNTGENGKVKTTRYYIIKKE